MKNDNYFKIKAACIKANPEIVEVRFGCWVATKSGAHRVLYTTKSETVVLDENIGRPQILMESFAVIGRKIRLTDVLLAMHTQQIRVQYSSGDDARIDYLRSVNPMTWIVAGIWDLRHDDLEQQSDELLDFFGGLLSV